MSYLNSLRNTFGEAYTIKGTYQKEDGFYTSFEETQLVSVVHGVNEKNNHLKAKELFIKENKQIENIRVSVFHLKFLHFYSFYL